MIDITTELQALHFDVFKSETTVRQFGHFFEQFIKAKSQTKVKNDFISLCKRHRDMGLQAVFLLSIISERLESDEKSSIDEINAIKLVSRVLNIQIMALTQMGEAGFEVTAMRASNRGKKAADALHDRDGGSRSKAEQIRKVWATGNFKSRDACADQEGAALGMSPSTARKALRGTPNPPKPSRSA